MDHQCRLVALATVWNGREERRVGLHQDAVDRSKGRNLSQAGGLGIGQVAGKGEMESKVERAVGLLQRAGEAVQDAGWIPPLARGSSEHGSAPECPPRRRLAKLLFGLCRRQL